ncbi:response regulator transcription factor, partial [Streptomyces sp. NPDC058527]|uniref:response regulator n=1 Tax=Streptomyces sp. NPDC058527 TaxID=3346539 RepID=UPI00364A70EE
MLSERTGRSGRTVKVVVADDEPLIRAGIRMILNSDPDIHVVAEAANGREAVDAARAHAADVVLLDIQMPVLDGLSALPELRRAAPAARVIVLTTFGERENVLRALEHGSAGFLLKDTAPAELIGAVRAAAAGDAVRPRRAVLAHIRSFLERAFAAYPLEGLAGSSPRDSV